MIKKITLSLCCSLFVATQSIAFANEVTGDCRKINGVIHTTNIDLTDPQFPTLGSFKIIISPTQDKTCGLQGSVTAFSDLGFPKKLRHKIACDDHTVIDTLDKAKDPVFMDECKAKVIEISKIDMTTPQGEHFQGFTKTTGIVNLCTNANDFTFVGKLCPEQ